MMNTFGMILTGYFLFGFISMVAIAITARLCLKTPKDINKMPKEQRDYVLFNDPYRDHEKKKKEAPAILLTALCLWPIIIPIMLNGIPKMNHDTQKRYEEVRGE